MIPVFAPTLAMPTAAGAAYTGPGDIVPSAIGWWGLRAYTTASIGMNIIRLREDGADTVQDFASIAGGGLDLAAITTFKGANNLFVHTLYDQAGANDLVQANPIAQPVFTLGGLGALPTMDDNGGGSGFSLASVTQTQPFTLSFVYKARSATDVGLLTFTTTIQIRPHFLGAADSVFVYAGAVSSSIPATDNVWHALQAVLNGTSGDGNMDGTQHTIDTGTNAPSALSMSYIDTPIGAFRGSSNEFGFWGSAFSPTDSSNMSTNQHAYWGF